MPSLTLNTSPGSRRGVSQDTESRPTSPQRPPYSPITPIISAARLAGHDQNAPHSSGSSRQTYRHSQPPQESISLPSFEPIDFENNPDVLAIKATASILQLQGARATADIQTIRRTKEIALADPAEFARALFAGEVKTASDSLFHPEQAGKAMDGEDGEAAEEEGAKSFVKYERLPAPQNIVRMPPINWAQYAVVGDSLDKLHEDQLARPTDGVPQRVGPDGQLLPGGEGMRRAANLGIGAPYQPSKDKIEKVGTRKGGKR